MSTNISTDRSRWRHTICDECWKALKEGILGREPHRIVNVVEETCCYCGRRTVSGIYVMDDPEALKCGGKHD